MSLTVTLVMLMNGLLGAICGIRFKSKSSFLLQPSPLLRQRCSN